MQGCYERIDQGEMDSERAIQGEKQVFYLHLAALNFCSFSCIPSLTNMNQMVPVNSPLEPGKLIFTQPSCHTYLCIFLCLWMTGCSTVVYVQNKIEVYRTEKAEIKKRILTMCLLLGLEGCLLPEQWSVALDVLVTSQK